MKTILISLLLLSRITFAQSTMNAQTFSPITHSGQTVHKGRLIYVSVKPVTDPTDELLRPVQDETKYTVFVSIDQVKFYESIILKKEVGQVLTDQVAAARAAIEEREVDPAIQEVFTKLGLREPGQREAGEKLN